jgi:2-methylisocitrate lyase-like PEP mutase family enzyme
MTVQAQKAEQFRALHIPGKPLILFNIWDAGSATAVATAGAKALATGSWSVAHANGFADGEDTPISFAVENLRRIVGATDLPVTVDLESGYGDTPEAVGETVALAIAAGAVGCNLEDSFPATGRLRTMIDQAARIRRARLTADAANIRLFINARTDIFFQVPADQHNDAMIADAIDRAHPRAGSDGCKFEFRRRKLGSARSSRANLQEQRPRKIAVYVSNRRSVVRIWRKRSIDARTTQASPRFCRR